MACTGANGVAVAERSDAFVVTLQGEIQARAFVGWFDHLRAGEIRVALPVAQEGCGVSSHIHTFTISLPWRNVGM